MDRPDADKLIGKDWLEYQRRVLPKNAGATQIIECRRAFYAGALCFYNRVMVLFDADGGEQAETPSAAAEDALVALADELREFNDDIGCGRA